MIYLLDANVLIHLANRADGSENIEMHIAKAGASALRLSAITVAELRRTIVRGHGRVKQDNLQRLRSLASQIKIEGFNAPAAEQAGDFMAALEAAGERNEWPDVLIAGQAAASGYTLVTDDAALLAMRGVAVENWRA